MGRILIPGDAAPWFQAPALGGRDDYRFSSIGGLHVLMLFYGSARPGPMAAALRLVADNRALFDDREACFFGVSIDPDDVAAARIAQSLPGIRHILDHDRAVSTLYGVTGGDGGTGYRPLWLLLDHELRVVATAPIERGAAMLDRLKQCVDAERGVEARFPPALVVPRVFEPDFCRRLIDHYDAGAAVPSGFMADVDGKTTTRFDERFKRRSDVLIEDEPLRRAIGQRLRRALLPRLAHAFAFEATRIERWLIGCYDAGEGGYFRPHRDNVTPGTAHRRFACTINLNAGDYDGGDLRFPEYGERTHRAPTGGAIIFSCALLHEATPVTRGRRYAFLPFFYDEAAAKVRAANNALLADDVAPYRPSTPSTAA